MGDLAVNLEYVHGPGIGYGRLGVNLALQLQNLGVTVYDHLPGVDDRPQPQLEHLGLVNAGRHSGLAETVCWVSVPAHARGWWTNQRPVLFSMWESTSLPESFRESFHEFTQIIVPSHQNLELFGRYHDSVSFVPLGVDPADWHYTPRQEVGAEFRFLIAGSGPRKGTDLAYAAFRKGFKTWPREGPKPVLVFKNPRGEDFHGDRIRMVTGRIPAADEVALYETAHCYLQPSRGEGFGLQPLQALAQGCPTVLTAAHGHDAFAHLGRGISASLAQSAYFIYGDAGMWWEPSLDELIDQMRWVYDHYDEALVEAKHAAEVVASEFTWRNTAERFVEAIGPEHLRPLEDKGEWYQPTRKLYTTVLNRDWQADIGGSSFQWRRGVAYKELADTKRILYEAGLLDPSCVTGEDTGLLPSQLERGEAYSARYEHCQLCGQELNSRPSRESKFLEALDA